MFPSETYIVLSIFMAMLQVLVNVADSTHVQPLSKVSVLL